MISYRRFIDLEHSLRDCLELYWIYVQYDSRCRSMESALCSLEILQDLQYFSFAPGSQL